MPIQFDQTNDGIITLSAASSGNWSTALPTGVGTSTQLLGTDGTNLSWITQTGISGFNYGISTSSPNATNNVAYVQSSTSNLPFVFGPKGTGGISLRVPDSGTSGGNVRGSYSVCLTPSGTVATDVASGNYAVAVGNSVEASGDYSVAIGNGAKAKGTKSVSIGKSATPSTADYAVVVGNSTYTTTADNSYSVSIGGNGMASGPYSVYLGGFGNAYDANVSGAFVWPNGGPVLGPSSTNTNIARRVSITFGADTTNATPTVVYTDGTTDTGKGYIKLLNNSATKITIFCLCAVKTAGGNVGGISGTFYATNNSGTITLTGSFGSAFGSAGFAPSASLAVDNTNKAVTLTITGIASTNIRWNISADLYMLTY